MNTAALDTARRSIRLAGLAAARTIEGLNIESPGMWDVPPVKMPALRLRVTTDTKRFTAKAPPISKTLVALEVQVYVTMSTDATAQDEAEAVSQFVEQAFLSNAGLIALINSFQQVETVVDLTTKGKAPIAKIDMAIVCETTETFVPRGPFTTLREIAIHFDAAGGPVDALGTYPGAAFPAAVPPAPRQTGPDGRDEGFLLIDTVTGSNAPRRPWTLRQGKIVDDRGRPIGKLRGWNWGVWGTIQPQDGVENVAAGATMVRIGIRWWTPEGNQNVESRDDTQIHTGFINPAYLAILDAAIYQADAAGLKINLFFDSNCGQNGTQPGHPPYCDMQGLYGAAGHNFWTDLAERTKYFAMMRFVLNRYRNVKNLVCVEPLVEPNPVTYSAADIRNFYQEAISSGRSIVPGMLWLVGGKSYFASAIGKSYLPDAGDTMYTADLFMPTVGSQDDRIANWNQKLADMVEFQTETGAAMICQQVGVTSGDDPTGIYRDTMLTALNDAGLPWEWWDYRDANGPNGFGAWWLDDDGTWIEKPVILNGVGSYFVA